MSRIIWILCVAILLPCSAIGQSLGELARKERDRRDENKTRGIAAREIAEDEIFEDDDAEESENEDGESSDESENDERSQSRSSVALDSALGASKGTDDDGRERKRRETDFRRRYSAAKTRVTHAGAARKTLEGISHVPGMEYVDENGNVVIASLDHLRRLVQEADAELKAAAAAIKALEEEARRGGYPKGWLR